MSWISRHSESLRFRTDAGIVLLVLTSMQKAARTGQPIRTRCPHRQEPDVQEFLQNTVQSDVVRELTELVFIENRAGWLWIHGFVLTGYPDR